MNSYFATVEQQLNPVLRDKPIGVIKAPGRTCIIAASVEAKKFGVKTGTTTWDSLKLCPQIVLVPSQMDHYFSMTKKLIKLAYDFSPDIEVFSIDEMFLDITDTQKLWTGGAFQMALEIKQRIHQDLGEWMRASIGISFTKLLAKTASEMQKPDGLTFLTTEDYILNTQNLPVLEVCGIGFSRAKWLQTRGLFTLGQARQYPNLPPEIADLVWLRSNDDLTTIEQLSPAKSVSRSYTTYRILNSKFEILNLIRNLCEEVALKLREMHMVARTFSVSMDGYHARRTINSPTDDAKIIYLLFANGQLPNEIRKAGVWASNLMFNTQCSMLNRRGDLFKAVDKINNKFGGFTIYPAQLLGGELIRPEITGYLGDKWYHFGGPERTRTSTSYETSS